jgi:hypothetical protein
VISAACAAGELAAASEASSQLAKREMILGTPVSGSVRIKDARNCDIAVSSVQRTELFDDEKQKDDHWPP